jgi:twitching motility protein PilI
MKKISRREFQEGLAQRLQLAARGETSRALLAILAGRGHWLFDLADAGEILPVPALASVPLTKPWFAGIANIRGTLHSVVDFSVFEGGEPTARNRDSRLLLIGTRHGINSALLVSCALGLKSPDTLEEQPESNDEARPWIGAHFIDNKGQHWHMMRVKELLTYPDFLDITG